MVAGRAVSSSQKVCAIPKRRTDSNKKHIPSGNATASQSHAARVKSIAMTRDKKPVDTTVLLLGQRHGHSIPTVLVLRLCCLHTTPREVY